MAIADDQESIVVKRVRDHVLVQIVAQVAVEARSDVLVNGFEFNEHERQSVDKADEIGSPL